MVLSCKSAPESKIDNGKLITEITGSEVKLFTLLKAGKIDEAFNMHSKDTTYRSIVDGVVRNSTQMDSLLKSNTSKNIKTYEYIVSSRSFLIVDNKNVLETVEANRQLLNLSDGKIITKPVSFSLLWSKRDAKWLIAYVHASYRK